MSETGGLTETSYAELLATRSDEMVRKTILGMLPHNRLGAQMGTKLKVYKGAEHPHAAQAPQPMEIPGARRQSSARSGA